MADIFLSQCLPELQSPDVNKHSVLRADSIRYLTTFRSILPRELLVNSLPVLITHLTASSVVVHTYSAHCIEKMLILKGAGNNKTITASDLQPQMEQLLVSLFNCLRMEGSLENEYVMKAIMRSMATMGDKIAPYSETLLKELTAKLALVSQNPSKPHFNHYLFESICCIIRYTCKSNSEVVSRFEASVSPLTVLQSQGLAILSITIK